MGCACSTGPPPLNTYRAVGVSLSCHCVAFKPKNFGETNWLRTTFIKGGLELGIATEPAEIYTYSCGAGYTGHKAKYNLIVGIYVVEYFPLT